VAVFLNTANEEAAVFNTASSSRQVISILTLKPFTIKFRSATHNVSAIDYYYLVLQ